MLLAACATACRSKPGSARTGLVTLTLACRKVSNRNEKLASGLLRSLFDHAVQAGYASADTGAKGCAASKAAWEEAAALHREAAAAAAAAKEAGKRRGPARPAADGTTSKRSTSEAYKEFDAAVARALRAHPKVWPPTPSLLSVIAHMWYPNLQLPRSQAITHM